MNLGTKIELGLTATALALTGCGTRSQDRYVAGNLVEVGTCERAEMSPEECDNYFADLASTQNPAQESAAASGSDPEMFVVQPNSTSTPEPEDENLDEPNCAYGGAGEKLSVAVSVACAADPSKCASVVVWDTSGNKDANQPFAASFEEVKLGQFDAFSSYLYCAAKNGEVAWYQYYAYLKGKP